MEFGKKTVNSAAEVAKYFPVLYGETSERQLKRYDKLIERFRAEKGKTGYMASSSGRVEVIGNHTDHNGGVAVGCAISLDTIAMFLPEDNGIITVKSEGYPDVVVDTASDKKLPAGSSDALVKGICEGFLKRGYKIGGFTACTTSNVAGGAGVSSSASFAKS